MKNRVIFGGLLSLIVIGLVACGTFGASPGPPTKTEGLIFNTVTNYTPVITPARVTNVQEVLVIHTNTQQIVQFQTNVLGMQVTERVTNVIPVVVYQTNTVAITVAAATNMVPQYTDTTKPAITAGIQTAGTAVNTFFPGIGGLVATGLTALVGLFGYLRSSKNYATSSALAQEIQVVRNFIQALPNGATYDATLTTFLQSHQADAGVLTQVLTLLKNEVSNPDATAAANGLIQTINTLSGVPTPVAVAPALSTAALHPIVALPSIPKPPV